MESVHVCFYIPDDAASYHKRWESSAASFWGTKLSSEMGRANAAWTNKTVLVVS